MKRDLSEPAYHRTGASSPLGKLDVQIKFNVDENTGALAVSEATQLGLSLSEYMRDLLTIHIHGAERIKSIYAARVDRVARNRAGNGVEK